MNIQDWDKEEIKKLTLVSGRPLEVKCAQAFLTAKWYVRLGTFVIDPITEKLHELDFLATRQFKIVFLGRQSERNITVLIRILGSCKGFLPDTCPATNSVHMGSDTVESPRFLSAGYGYRGREVANTILSQSSFKFLQSLPRLGMDQIVAFEILGYDPGTGKKAPSYYRKTDKDLIEGLNSAIRAALYWKFQDNEQFGHLTDGDSAIVAIVNIPLLVLSRPFWNVSIDNGTAANPELKEEGFHVSLFPSRPGYCADSVMSVLWCSEKLDLLIGRLEEHVATLNLDVRRYLESNPFAVCP